MQKATQRGGISLTTNVIHISRTLPGIAHLQDKKISIDVYKQTGKRKLGNKNGTRSRRICLDIT